MKFDLGEYSVETDGDNFYIAETAIVLGKVKLCTDASVWFGAVLSGDFFVRVFDLDSVFATDLARNNN